MSGTNRTRLKALFLGLLLVGSTLEANDIAGPIIPGALTFASGGLTSNAIGGSISIPQPASPAPSFTSSTASVYSLPSNSLSLSFYNTSSISLAPPVGLSPSLANLSSYSPAPASYSGSIFPSGFATSPGVSSFTGFTPSFGTSAPSMSFSGPSAFGGMPSFYVNPVYLPPPVISAPSIGFSGLGGNAPLNGPLVLGAFDNPEPSTGLLIVTGVAAVWLWRRKRAKA